MKRGITQTEYPHIAFGLAKPFNMPRRKVKSTSTPYPALAARQDMETEEERNAPTGKGRRVGVAEGCVRIIERVVKLERRPVPVAAGSSFGSIAYTQPGRNRQQPR